MEPNKILRQLSEWETLPVEALRAASERRDAMVPLLRQAFEEQVAHSSPDPDRSALLLLAFHLLGEWRETSAYRPLCRFLRRPEAEHVLGDAVTETSHRVMAAVFDGDPQPLLDVILDQEADEFVRSKTFEALGLLVIHDRIDRDLVAQFLRDCFDKLLPQGESYVWIGWQSAISLLGLSKMRPQVKAAFERGFIDDTIMELRHFEGDLAYALDHPESPRELEELGFFDDTIEALSGWARLRGSGHDEEPGWLPDKLASDDAAPYVNPLRYIGRNDPCPCGSGKKFKRCCGVSS